MKTKKGLRLEIINIKKRLTRLEKLFFKSCDVCDGDGCIEGPGNSDMGCYTKSKCDTCNGTGKIRRDCFD